MAEERKNLVLRDIELTETVNNAELALKAYHKGLLDKGELELLIGINLESGDPIKVWDILQYYKFLMMLRDLNLVTDDVVRKQLFGLEPREVTK